MVSRTSYGLLIFVALMALIAVVTAQEHVIARGSYYGGELTTTATGKFQCNMLECAQYVSARFAFGAGGSLPQPSSIKLTFSENSISSSNIIPTIQTLTYPIDNLNTDESWAQDVSPFTGPKQIYWFAEFTWDSSLTAGVNLSAPQTLEIQFQWFNDATKPVMIASTEIVLTAGETLEVDHSSAEPEVNERQFSARIIPASSVTAQPAATTAHKTVISFTNYYDNRVTGFDLVLSGANYFLANTTHFWDNACTVNGNTVRAELNIGVEAITKDDLRVSQWIHLDLPTEMIPLMGKNALISISCGDNLNNMYILTDPSITRGFAVGSKPAEFLSFFPVYETLANVDYPQGLYTITLDSTTLDSMNSLPQVNLSPLYVYADKKLKDLGSVAVSAAFEVQLADISDYSRPLEISFTISGLEIDTIKTSQNKDAYPRAMISIEPDYSLETIKNGDKTPKTPENLFTPFYIIPFDVATGSTVTLYLPNGFLSTYSENAPNTFGVGVLPTRTISVIIPLNPVKIRSYPLEIETFVRFPQTDSTITVNNPLTISIASLINNSAAEKDPKLYQWKSSSIQASRLTFDVHPVSKNYYTKYPNLVQAQFPTYKYRFSFPFSTSAAMDCVVTREYCTTDWTGTIGNRSRTRTCRMIPDNAYQFKTSFLSQSRVDLNVRSLTGIPPDSWRRVECRGTQVIEQKPWVFDFRNVDPQNSQYTPSMVELPLFSWAPIQQDGVSPITNHKFTLDGTVVGYTEVYGLKNRLSTLAIVMLCLIPVWIAIAAAIIIVPIMILK